MEVIGQIVIPFKTEVEGVEELRLLRPSNIPARDRYEPQVDLIAIEWHPGVWYDKVEPAPINGRSR